MKTRNWIIGIVLLTLPLAAFILRSRATAHPLSASSAEIKIDNFTFAPTMLIVRKGTRITWTNRDDIPHTVVENDKLFKSHVLDTGEAFTFTPTQPGTYKYYCSIHPKMTAELIVR
jgi:plastocyanin